MASDKRFFAACPRDCYDTCAMYAFVNEGRIAKVVGRRDHGLTKGFLCRKGQNILDYVYSPDRLLYPMERTGAKGSGQFRRVAWDYALSKIAEKLMLAASECGPLSILPYDYAGHMGIISNYFPHRLFNRIGASELLDTMCSAAGTEALKYHYGTCAGMDPEDMINSALILAWGCNPAWTAQHIFAIAKNSNAKMVVIDPVRTETAEQAHMHLQLKPGTDSALALGVINYAITEGLYDGEFIDKCTKGFSELRESVKGFTPERVCDICGLDKRAYMDFAELYCKTKPAAIMFGFGMQRNANGGEMVRAIGLLPAITGNLGRVGGGFFYSNSSYFTVDWGKLKGTELGRGRRKINMVRLGETLLDASMDPPIKLLYVYNSNPAAICPDLNRVRQGLLREDLFTVVHDLFMTDTAECADLVLPATSYFESFDVHFTYGGLYVALNEKAIEPIGECKSNYEVAAELCNRMGYSDLVEDQEILAADVLKTGTGFMKGITLEELKEKGFVRLKTPKIPHVAFSDFIFPTPSGKVEIYSTIAEEEGAPPLPVYTEVAGEYPLRLLSPFHRDLHKSQYFNIPRIFGSGEQVLEICAEDALSRGIADGDRVRVHNGIGYCSMMAKVSTKVKRGVVLSYGITWPKLVSGGRTANHTTSSQLADHGEGSTFHTNFVEVERAEP